MTNNNRLSSILDEELQRYNSSMKSTDIIAGTFAGSGSAAEEVRISSVEVAEVIGKQHKHLMRDIRQYIEHLSDGPNLDREISTYFIESNYVNSRGQEQPMYLLSKKGCELVATRMTGAKGTQFAVYYINRFNEMERELAQANVPSYQIEDSISRAERWIEEERERLQLVATVEEQRPKVEYHDDVLRSESTMPITVIAKEFGRSAQSMNVLLNEAGVQYKRGNTWIPYSQYQEAGYMRPITYNANGQYAVTAYQWTEKGRKFIHELMRDVYGELPVYSLQ